ERTIPGSRVFFIPGKPEGLIRGDWGTFRCHFSLRDRDGKAETWRESARRRPATSVGRLSHNPSRASARKAILARGGQPIAVLVMTNALNWFSVIPNLKLSFRWVVNLPVIHFSNRMLVTSAW